MNIIKLLFLIAFCYLNATIISSQNLISGYEGQSTYYEIASDLKQVLPNLNVVTSGGSVENLNKLLDGTTKINLAMVQYDVLLRKQLEEPEVKNKIELVFPLYKEEIHLITISPSIKSITDLENKTVAIGSISQGTNVSSNLIISRLGIKCKTVDIAFRDAISALLNDQIDAFFFVGGVPVTNLASFPEEVSSIIKLVPIENSDLGGIYENTIIKAGDYPWLKSDINTVYIQSYIVSNNQKSVEISELMSAIQSNLRDFQQGDNFHPKWQEISFDAQFHDWPVNQKAQEFIRNLNNHQ